MQKSLENSVYIFSIYVKKKLGFNFVTFVPPAFLSVQQ